MGKHAKIIFLGVFLMLNGLQMEARHIIGGNITYKCLGNDRYRFTLEMYRDCNCTNCAFLDPSASVAAYLCASPNGCMSSNLFIQGAVNLESTTQIATPDYPCLIPPDVCVERGVYHFEMVLPQSDQSYFVAFQRCCRNVTISNIINPEAQGATYFVEIPPAAQQVCNNSPTFNTFPPTVLCAGQPFSYDHSATDIDGDQLVYEFCAPFKGGGNNTDATLLNTCIGAQPIPACPPPYSNVQFTAPNYTPLFPMGGSPAVNINSSTGVISGTPVDVGQFVVGVCVSEYRNGVLLSRIYRDFQFNVASCDPQVIADIEEDAIINGQEFVINSCGNATISIKNQSYQVEYIDEFRWEFDLNGELLVLEGSNNSSGNWSPTVTFPGTGTYEGILFLNPGFGECSDTAYIHVNVFPDIAADFSFEYDTCVAGPVQFTDLSTTGSCCMTDWDWSFGDANASSEQNPSHIYQHPGNIPVTLTVRDTNDCREAITHVIEYFPVPNLIVIAPSEFKGCAPADIFFDNLSFPIDETYDLNWDFGDGLEGSNEISPWHNYTETGIYTVSVDITSPIGCTTDTTFNDLIEIVESPIAGFDYSPDQPSSLLPTVDFTDESERSAGIYWDFGDGDFSSQWNPTHTYQDTGVVQVMQIVTHLDGCKDTLIKILDIIPEVKYFLPNAFTPNFDSVNDEYFGVGILDGATDFEMLIWNRWGELIFKTNDPKEGWNGTKNNVGKPVPNGVYLVMVKYKEPRGDLIELKGYATLIR